MNVKGDVHVSSVHITGEMYDVTRIPIFVTNVVQMNI